MSLTRPRRYQLKKAAARVIAGGHPWVFRKSLSTAADVFADGQWLRLVDGGNRVVGHGIYQAEGAIGIRVLERGERLPDAAWVGERCEAALARRAELRLNNGAFRAVHGENDGLPAVVVDVYGTTGVLQTYAAGADPLGRLVAARIADRLDVSALAWKPARRARTGGPASLRWLRGRDPGVITWNEGSLGAPFTYAAEIGGQKSGAFLDLRGLRRWLTERALSGARVLNLFSYTGTLGAAAARAGAREVWNVDQSEAALAFAAHHHQPGGCRFRSIPADIFSWLPDLDPAEQFDLIIVDPPSMTSRQADVPRALAAYQRLYRAAVSHLAPGGTLIACCCTSRIRDADLRSTVARATAGQLTFRERLPPEPDHPVSFPEADYLKLQIWGRS